MNKLPRFWLVVLGSVLLGPTVLTQAQTAADRTADQLLVAGRYAQIPSPKEKAAHSVAVWAFAQYHLAPNKEVAQAAQFAHNQGDDLGTFVLLLCQRTGAGVSRDRAQAAALNFALRTKLEKKNEPTPLELYMLSQCQPGNEKGEHTNPDVEKLFAEVKQQRQWRINGS